LQNEGHAQAGKKVQEKGEKLPINGTDLRNQMLDQLSPHPNCLRGDTFWWHSSAVPPEGIAQSQ
jgi:hypothetical protein